MSFDPSSDGLVTDVHAHILTPGIVAAALAGEHLHGIKFGTTPEGSLESSFGDERVRLVYEGFPESIERRIEIMDSLRVDRHLLSLSPGIHWYGTSDKDGVAHARQVNDELAEIVAGHPTRFMALSYLPLQDAKASAGELERARGELGFVGAVLGSNINGKDWDDPELFPILETAAQLNCLLFIHPTRVRGRGFLDRYHMKNLLGNPLETSVAFCSLVFGGVLDKLPDLQILLAHGGGFACTGVGRIDHGYSIRPEASKYAQRPPSDYLHRIYLDSLVHSHDTLRYILDQAGSDRVMLGTDYPADMGQPDPRAWIEDAPALSDDERTAILSGNFEQFTKSL